MERGKKQGDRKKKNKYEQRNTWDSGRVGGPEDAGQVDPLGVAGAWKSQRRRQLHETRGRSRQFLA